MKTAGQLQIQIMKAAKRLKKSQAPPKPRKPTIPTITKAKFRRAMEGTHGNKTTIASRLDCAYQTVINILARPEWADVRQEYQNELDRLADIAETCIEDTIKQRVDLSVASTTARWLLSRKRHQDRQLGDESKVTVDGGTPVTINNNVISVEVLDLPVEVKRVVLEALEKRIMAEAEQTKLLPSTIVRTEALTKENDNGLDH